MAAKRARESVHELAEYAEATVRAAKRLTRAGSDDLEWAELKNPAIGEEIRCTVQLSKLVLAKTVSVEAWKDDPSKFMPSPTELAQREADEAPTKQLDKTYTWQL